MAGGGASIGSYSPFTGFVFIFNLIVGAGALTIPHAFANVGLLYGVLALTVLASVSYVTATFMLETIAGVNALKKRARELGLDASNDEKHMAAEDYASGSGDDAQAEFLPLMVANEKQDSLDKKLRVGEEPRFHFDLSQKMELAQMAELLFSRRGNIAFYTCVIVYLYGDLAIYAVAVPKSMREIICPRPSPELTVWECSERFNSSDLYRLFVVLFGLLLGPFTFGHVHKTRTLQLVTTVIRHASFGLMILLAIVGIARGEGRSMADVIGYEKPANVATFFGVCIYSFMCHHSIPGLVAPITDKSKVGAVLAGSFVAVLSVYFVLCASATFRFQPEDIEDVYTLNFKAYPVQFFAYFLSLFPVFTLSASFPLICITLRENIRQLLTSLLASTSVPTTPTGSAGGFLGFLEKHVYALIALMPPLVVAFFTEDVSMLVGFTGAYAGLGIQWVVPTFLVLCLRRRLAAEWKAMRPMEAVATRPGATAARGNVNQFASPFAHPIWVHLTFAFSLASVVLITLTHGMH